MITTQGFRVSNLARYTPVDPKAVAFDPTQFLGGAMDAAQYKAVLQQLRMRQAQEEELAATRDARLAAEKAKLARSTATDTAFTPISQMQADLERGKINQGLALLDPQTKALLSSFNLSAEKNEADRSMIPDELLLRGAKVYQEGRALPFETNARITNAEMAGIRANDEMARIEASKDTYSPLAQAAIAQANANRGNAKISIRTNPYSMAAAIEGAKGMAGRAQDDELLKNAKLGQALEAFDQENQDRDKRLKAFQEQKAAAEIKSLEADAAYKMGLGRQTGRVMSPTQELQLEKKQIIEEIAKLRTGGMTSSGKPLGGYLQDTYNDDGSIKSGGFLWQSTMPTDALGDSQKKVLDSLGKRLQEIDSVLYGTGKQLPKSSLSGNKQASGIPDGTKRVVEQNGTKYNVIYRNGKWVEDK